MWWFSVLMNGPMSRFKELLLTYYSDADLGGDLDERKSTGAFVFTIGTTPINMVSQKTILCSALIHWIGIPRHCRSYQRNHLASKSLPWTRSHDETTCPSLLWQSEHNTYTRKSHVTFEYKTLRNSPPLCMKCGGSKTTLKSYSPQLTIGQLTFLPRHSGPPKF